VFVGPPADVIERMGRKDVARHVAVVADVPVVPAIEQVDGEDDDALADRAVREVGFPLLVKAAAGGGGKGMRIVRTPEELRPGLAAPAARPARRSATTRCWSSGTWSAGGTSRCRCWPTRTAPCCTCSSATAPCSAATRRWSRRRPHPPSAPAVRERVTSAAVRLCQEVGYVNAGTVEFLVDGEDVFFLEMNTRLQVEHPVTELVTGLDLVALQLEVAQGKPLPLTQEQVTVTGSALEARVYAEDPAAGFLPQAGVATTVRWSGRARVDHALESGQRVGTWYDPMLGKVITHGPTREAARRALVAALDDTAVLGLTTNLGFLRRLVDSDVFRDAGIDTAWLDREPGAFPAEPPDTALVLAAWALAATPVGQDRRHPFGAADGWRVAGPPAPVVLELDSAGTRHVLHVDLAQAPSSRGSGAGTSRRCRRRPAGCGWRSTACCTRATSRWDRTASPSRTTATRWSSPSLTRSDRPVRRRPPDGVLTAPMPGVVPGGPRGGGGVGGRGTVLGVLEAMKMELALQGPYDGVVTSSERPSATASTSARRCSRWRSRRHEDAAGRAAGGAAGARHDLRGGPAGRPAEREGRGPGRGQGRVRPPAGGERPAHGRDHQLRAGDVGPAARRRRGAARAAGRRAGRRPRPRLVPNEKGLQRALALGVRDVAVFASATESFARRNLNRTMAEQYAMFEPVVAGAREAGLAVRGYVSMCFGDPWEGEVPPASVVDVVVRLREMGCTEISLGDTIGTGTPGHVRALLAGLADVGVPVAETAVHFHDTYGQALANTLAALQAGVTTVDASAGGLGGCPYAKSATGNLATEDLVWQLRGLGVETGVDLEALAATSTWMAAQLGRPTPLAHRAGAEPAGRRRLTAHRLLRGSAGPGAARSSWSGVIRRTGASGAVSRS
jgi:acetyl/propionyl-CoA carboxylase alpha subunit